MTRLMCLVLTLGDRIGTWWRNVGPCPVCESCRTYQFDTMGASGLCYCQACQRSYRLPAGLIRVGGAVKYWRRWLARMRLNLTIVCEESRGMGHVDYHDYPDDKYGSHMCLMVVLKCVRCGKDFTC